MSGARWPTKEERASADLRQEVCPFGCGEVRFVPKDAEHDPWKHHEDECRALNQSDKEGPR